MEIATAGALVATIGFASGDVFTALLARKVSGSASMLMLTLLKLALYLPFALVLYKEFSYIDAYVVWWSALLGILFFAGYWGFNMGLQTAKNPALVGVVAGCFPASAAVVGIVFLHQRPSLTTLALLALVLVGVVLIGLPENWRKSLKFDKGILLSLLPLVCWGVFGMLLHKPVGHLGTAHGWFVIQTLVAVTMVVAALLLYNRRTPSIVRDTSRKKAWVLVLWAGIIIGIAEALQAYALGSGKNLIIIEALLGSYPAAYFIMANRVFREPLRKMQWAGIVLVVITIVLLSIGGTS
jgi:drug/metabolite transporter (DMT)-like permease